MDLESSDVDEKMIGNSMFIIDESAANMNEKIELYTTGQEEPSTLSAFMLISISEVSILGTHEMFGESNSKWL